MTALPPLLLVTDRTTTRGRELVKIVRAAIDAGLRFVQLRERDLDDQALGALANRLRDPRATLVVNGRPTVARAQRIGLHLPAADASPPPDGILPLGRSVHDVDEALTAVRRGADYLVAGTVFSTPSKPGHRGAGPALVRAITAVAGRVPVFAIGGMNAARVGQVRAAGAHGVAVCRAILADDDPGAATIALLNALRASNPRALP